MLLNSQEIIFIIVFSQIVLSYTEKRIEVIFAIFDLQLVWNEVYLAKLLS